MFSHSWRLRASSQILPETWQILDVLVLIACIVTHTNKLNLFVCAEACYCASFAPCPLIIHLLLLSQILVILLQARHLF